MNRDHYFSQVKQDFDTYKFYMEFALKAAIFSFGITGGIVSYYLAHLDQELMRYALVLPFLFNVAFGAICIYGMGPAKFLINDQKRLAKGAELGMGYEMSPLRYLLFTFAVVYLLSATGLLALFCHPCF